MADGACADELEAVRARARRLHTGGELLAALRLYDRLIVAGAADADCWRATGDALADLGELAQAVDAYRHSAALAPDRADTEHQLARALFNLGEVGASVRALRRAIARTDAVDHHLALATIVPGDPAATARDVLDVRRALAARLAASAPQACLRPFSGKTRSRRRLRVGYLSAFFHRPNYMKPVWALVNHHDRAALEVHLIGERAGGEAFAGYRAHRRDVVHDVSGLDNAELARFVDALDLDLLVDLNGYSVPERLPLLLASRARATVAWFNMYGASGLPGVGHLVGDRWVIADAEAPDHDERLHALDVSYLTFQPDDAAPVPGASASTERGGAFTFGSLAAQYKLTDEVIATWAEILRRVPGSELLIANTALGSVVNREHLCARFARHGLDPERLRLHGPAPHHEYLGHYDAIDLALDPAPYNGGSTTMEALWQGVPVLAARGDRWAARISASLVANAGLGEYVIDDPRALVDSAVALAGVDGEGRAR